MSTGRAELTKFIIKILTYMYSHFLKAVEKVIPFLQQVTLR